MCAFGVRARHIGFVLVEKKTKAAALNCYVDFPKQQPRLQKEFKR